MAQRILSTPTITPATRPTVALPGLKTLLVGGLLALLVGLLLVSLALGSVTIPLEEVLRVLLGGEASKAVWTSIIRDFRLPQALTAILAGAALGVSGLLMQTFFRNPLADPFVLGVSSGASLGVALVVLTIGSVTTTLLTGLGVFGDLALAAAASFGSVGVMAIILLVARRVSGGTTLLIIGLLFGYLTSAVVSVLLYLSIPERIQAYINWTFGSFSGVTWDQLTIMAPVIIGGLSAAFLLCKPLNALLLGEAYAESMGVNLPRVRFALILASAVLAGTITAFCGPIGFLGIAVPHFCRSLFNTSDHRALIPLTILVGAVVALLAAIIADVPGSSLVLPLNAVTSLIGAPAVIWVILSRHSVKAAAA
ncbi:MAG: iron ABC transporter permease [Anaerolineae bacterium]|uniref:iron ABC transporter permease n=1 Tax=Candidatus Flexifilum breve TaxID=3140694 RepID=UPI001AC248A8|nr:iron ABC transporter permease [Chloroflexota bacterium]MBN8640035.1 iron ABC transporter permease [Anaerolineae bacterium]